MEIHTENKDDPEQNINQNQTPKKQNNQPTSIIAQTLEGVKQSKEISRQSSYANQANQNYAELFTDNPQNDSRSNNILTSIQEHKYSLQELECKLSTNLINGLSQEEAIIRNLKQGDNILTTRIQQSQYIVFLKEMTNAFQIMLIIGGILCLVSFILRPNDTYQIYLAIALFLLVILTASITYQQRRRSEELMNSFKTFLPNVCNVIRDGVRKQINSEKLVTGDVVELKIGDRIPADIRIIKSKELKVDNSALTGESRPLLRTVDCTNYQEPLESKNLAFFGTVCKQGVGRGVVIRIGDQTILGLIADVAFNSSIPKTPLRTELDRFVIMISLIAITLGVTFFLIAFFVKQQSFLQCCIFGIGILIANVPEGLLGCITITLAITAKLLATKKILVRNLEAVETLGSTSCICSDKTGTLTQNKMLVEHLWYDRQARLAESMEKYGSEYPYQYKLTDPTFIDLHQNAVINSEAVFNSQEILDRHNKLNGTKEFDIRKFKWDCTSAGVIGDQTECALIKFFQPIEDINLTRVKNKVIFDPEVGYARVPFSSINKYSISICEKKKDKSYFTLYIKGAPEEVWQLCSHIAYQGQEIKLDNNIQREMQNINLEFGKRGERVLGFAKLDLNKDQFPLNFKFDVESKNSYNFPQNGYTFLGLISMMDPPKFEVQQTIQKCKTAGIKLVMITGDQASTATAIARHVGILNNNSVNEIKSLDIVPNKQQIIVTGQIIKKLLNSELPKEQKEQIFSNWCSKDVIFARTNPAQKLLIVKAFQSLDLVVATIGDGVNDSPAIKQSDIGIAMASGADVTKDSADMVLVNDDFSSIIDGIEEGRRIFDNLKKTIVYLLTSNCAEIWPFLAMVSLGIPLPLSSVFMLLICMGTDILPALSLAYEDSEIDVMIRQPRQKTEHLVGSKLLVHAYGLQGTICTAAGFFAYFCAMYLYGFEMGGLINLINIQGISPQNAQGGNYHFDENSLYLGNLNLVSLSTENESESVCDPQGIYPYVEIQWLYQTMTTWDLRNSLVKCDICPEGIKKINDYEGKYCWLSQLTYKSCDDPSISPVTGKQICYSIEALNYAQTSYFLAVVSIQWLNILSCKCRRSSLFSSKINRMMFLGIFVETIICIFAVCLPFMWQILNSRRVPLSLFYTNAFPFGILLFTWEEVRKYLIRNSKIWNNFFQKHSLW